jgi:hypothetical protein
VQIASLSQNQSTDARLSSSFAFVSVVFGSWNMKLRQPILLKVKNERERKRVWV